MRSIEQKKYLETLKQIDADYLAEKKQIEDEKNRKLTELVGQDAATQRKAEEDLAAAREKWLAASRRAKEARNKKEAEDLQSGPAKPDFPDPGSPVSNSGIPRVSATLTAAARSFDARYFLGLRRISRSISGSLSIRLGCGTPLPL